MLHCNKEYNKASFDWSEDAVESEKAERDDEDKKEEKSIIRFSTWRWIFDALEIGRAAWISVNSCPE